MRYLLFLFFIIPFLGACCLIDNHRKESIIKQYRNNKLVTSFSIDETQFVDSGAYCLVQYDSLQLEILDSSFYLNGNLNGYSFKRQNALNAIGNYIQGKKSGWFDYFKGNTLVQSNYYINDTLFQSTYHSSDNQDSTIIFVPELGQSFEQITKRNEISQNPNWFIRKSNDSLLIVMVTAVNRFQNTRYEITDDENKIISVFNNHHSAYFTFTISNNEFRKYDLTIHVSDGNREYSNKQHLITTPFKKI